MNQLNNMEKFDSLFSSAAAEYELAFDQNAWQLIQQKLDTNNTKKRFAFWWWLLAIGLLSISILFFITNNSKKITSENSVKKEILASKNDIETNENNKTEIFESPLSKNNNTIQKEDIKSQKSNVANQRSAFNLNDKKFGLISSTIKEKKSDSKTDNITKKTKKSDLENNSINNSKISTNLKNNTKNKNEEMSKTIDEISNLSTHSYTPLITYFHNRYFKNFKQLETENVIIAKNREEEQKRLVEAKNKPMFLHTIPSNNPSNRWFLNASVANNIPYVSNPQIKNSVLQFQFGIGYNISKNISIQTGLSFGNRSFDMRKDQFSYKGPGAFEKSIRNINADLSLIEVPITLKYQLSTKENYSWFGTFGISSLFFNKENYLLTIDDGSTIQYLPQNFSNTKSILSMLNLSIGYQFPVNNNISITTEPYIQLPFKSIGEGGSKISSIGIQLGIKYQFLKKKK